MRALKLILAALFAAAAATVALLAGVLAAAVVAAIGLGVYFGRRLLGRPPAVSAPPPAPRRRPASDGDAIEVTATEIASVSTQTSDSAGGPPSLPPGGTEVQR